MITNDLIKLGRAMIEYEGWNPLNGGGANNLIPTVSYRNHNPGNLRSSPFAVGKSAGFAIFIDDNIGFFALIWDIWMKSNGKTSTGLKASSTIEHLIHIWAPTSENDTESYIKFIEARTGLPRSMTIGNLVK